MAPSSHWLAPLMLVAPPLCRKLGPPALGGPTPQLPRLSAASQEQFLSYAEYLSREGAGALLAEVQVRCAPPCCWAAPFCLAVGRALKGLAGYVGYPHTQAAHYQH